MPILVQAYKHCSEPRAAAKSTCSFAVLLSLNHYSSYHKSLRNRHSHNMPRNNNPNLKSPRQLQCVKSSPSRHGRSHNNPRQYNLRSHHNHRPPNLSNCHPRNNDRNQKPPHSQTQPKYTSQPQQLPLSATLEGSQPQQSQPQPQPQPPLQPPQPAQPQITPSHLSTPQDGTHTSLGGQAGMSSATARMQGEVRRTDDAEAPDMASCMQRPERRTDKEPWTILSREEPVTVQELRPILWRWWTLTPGLIGRLPRERSYMSPSRENLEYKTNRDPVAKAAPDVHNIIAMSPRRTSKCSTTC